MNNSLCTWPFLAHVEEMDNECMRASTHACAHTRTALLESIKSQLINVLIKLNCTIYLRGKKREETSSHAISLIAPSESEMPACARRAARNPTT